MQVLSINLWSPAVSLWPSWKLLLRCPSKEAAARNMVDRQTLAFWTTPEFPWKPHIPQAAPRQYGVMEKVPLAAHFCPPGAPQMCILSSGHSHKSTILRTATWSAILCTHALLFPLCWQSQNLHCCLKTLRVQNCAIHLLMSWDLLLRHNCACLLQHGQLLTNTLTFINIITRCSNDYFLTL